MKKIVRSLITIIPIALLAVGCSETASPTSPSVAGVNSATPIAGTWTLATIQPAGQAQQAVPAGASYELSLADGRVSTRADCNVCGGSVVVGDQTLTVGPQLACTRAACPTMAFENLYVAILAGDSTTRIDGSVLTLTSARGELRFRR